ncbi:beta-lactamase family protein [Paenibacillus sp. J22TS3]|uniref:beta-lactamase family protein n=1 Tax=Paenibacillus sp. J22TS3 TaxID=2807192 RepID=UPI001B2D6889|nr:beta-lactamase family protein [Paenibacillus sp. J22TS3]GIP21719.1 hypothetical protein J22TS3_19940 [Paenibacillus sp. J22TS3]
MKRSRPSIKKAARLWLPAITALTLSASLAAPGMAAPAAGTSAAPAGQNTGAVLQVSGQPAGPIDPKELEAFADKFFAREDVKKLQVPGAVFVVVKDGRILFQKGYGYADREKKTPVSPETTVFRIASVTKVVTATALMQLVEQGKINLEDNVEKYLGGLKIQNNTGLPLKVKHLLTHSTGFDVVDIPITESMTTDLTKVVSLRDYIKEHMPTVVSPPGKVYRYDNFASMLQGYIVQEVSGVPYSKYIQEHILRPLDMNRTYSHISPEIQDKLATGYDDLNAAMAPYNLVPTDLPQGGLLTTGSDMTRFMIAHLEGDRPGQAPILTKESIAAMHTPQLAIHPKVPNMTYGFEYSYRDAYNGQDVVGKGGVAPGFSSWLWLMPKQRVGGFIVTNKSGPLREMLFREFMNHYYPKPANTGTGKPDGETGKVSLTPQQLHRLEGIYRSAGVNYVLTRIQLNDKGQLILKDLTGTQELTPLGPLLFLDKMGQEVAFQENEDGTIGYMFSKLNSAAYAAKLPDAEPFRDIAKDHPYAAYIHGMKQLGLTAGKPDGTFGPQEPMTRYEFITAANQWLGVPASRKPVVFTDLAGKPGAELIQSALDMGFVQGAGGGLFKPDQPITRQEAASIVWRMLTAMGIPPKPAKVSEEPAVWAKPAVEAVVAYRLYGPEVKRSADGAADYGAKRIMTRQEAAALLEQATHMQL